MDNWITGNPAIGAKRLIQPSSHPNIPNKTKNKTKQINSGL